MFHVDHYQSMKIRPHPSVDKQDRLDVETQIISKPIEMTHFRQLPSLSQQFLEPPENISGSFALVKF